MLMDNRKRAEDTWKTILRGKRILSEKEAKSMLKILKNSKKEYGFRT